MSRLKSSSRSDGAFVNSNFHKREKETTTTRKSVFQQDATLEGKKTKQENTKNGTGHNGRAGRRRSAAASEGSIYEACRSTSHQLHSVSAFDSGETGGREACSRTTRRRAPFERVTGSCSAHADSHSSGFSSNGSQSSVRSHEAAAASGPRRRAASTAPKCHVVRRDLRRDFSENLKTRTSLKKKQETKTDKR